MLKFIQLQQPERHYISHHDQEVKGLGFRVFYSDSRISLYGVAGEDTAIQDYIARFGGRISELSGAEMKAAVEARRPPGPIQCDMCNGTGQLTVPEFNPTEAEKEVTPWKRVSQ